MCLIIIKTRACSFLVLEIHITYEEHPKIIRLENSQKDIFKFSLKNKKWKRWEIEIGWMLSQPKMQVHFFHQRIKMTCNSRYQGKGINMGCRNWKFYFKKIELPEWETERIYEWLELVIERLKKGRRKEREKTQEVKREIENEYGREDRDFHWRENFIIFFCNNKRKKLHGIFLLSLLYSHFVRGKIRI